MNLTSILTNRDGSKSVLYDGYIEDAPVLIKVDGVDAVSGRCWQNDELRELDESYADRHLGEYIAQRLDSRHADGVDITSYCDEFKQLYSRWFFQPEGTMTSDESILIVFGESLIDRV